MIQTFNLSKLTFTIILLLFSLLFSCNNINTSEEDKYVYFRIKLPNNNKILILNVNERKELDIELFDEKDSDFLKLYSSDPSVIEVESNKTRVLRARKSGIAVIYAELYQTYKIGVLVRVYDNTIQPK